MESGGIIIMKNNLNDIRNAITLSKETVEKIKQNLFFSLFYNIL
jgi:Cu+-exporting ATPase